MTTIKASQLTLEEIYRLLNLVEKYDDVSLIEFFSLEPLTEAEKQEIVQIRNDFRSYLLGRGNKASEGQVKALTTFLLLRLAGFYHYPLQIKVEEGIDNIVIEDEDKTITGRFDLVIVNKATPTINDVPFWILVIEAKESGVESTDNRVPLTTGLPVKILGSE